MAKQRTEEIVYNLAQPIVDKNSLELVDVEFKKEGQKWVLRVYIDKENGVGLDDCQRVSEELGNLLDEKDPITDSYFLEVSSPGLDRPLKKDSDFLKYMDREIEITLYQPMNNSKYFKGMNKGIHQDALKMTIENEKIIQIPVKSIASARLYFEF
ncbi:MAG: ribosome maturation factor RimP [Eubacteriales bacterium]